MEHTQFRLTLLDFSRFELTGVEEVTAFQPTQIELSLSDSVLLLGGDNLKIDLFSQEEKRVLIHGQIDSIFREPMHPMQKTRFFSRFFR